MQPPAQVEGQPGWSFRPSDSRERSPARALEPGNENRISLRLRIFSPVQPLDPASLHSHPVPGPGKSRLLEHAGVVDRCEPAACASGLLAAQQHQRQQGHDRQLCPVALLSGGRRCDHLVWSVADRKRPNYERLYDWFRLYLRMVLAAIMIPYGAAKLFQAQFPAPSLSTLLEPYGDSSPMHLLWTFMGASPSYSFFAGAVEVLGGALLIVPRLTTLGRADLGRAPWPMCSCSTLATTCQSRYSPSTWW